MLAYSYQNLEVKILKFDFAILEICFGYIDDSKPNCIIQYFFTKCIFKTTFNHCWLFEVKFDLIIESFAYAASDR